MQEKKQVKKLKFKLKRENKKEKKKEEENRKKERKTPQNCKSPMQRQRFITTVKNVTEGTKQSSKAQLNFIVPRKLTTTTEGGDK